METTIWVAVIVAVATLLASFPPHWYLNKKAREDVLNWNTSMLGVHLDGESKMGEASLSKS